MSAAAVSNLYIPRSLTPRQSRVLRALLRGPVPTEDVRILGSLNGPATIHELRKMQFRIATTRRVIHDADGLPCIRAVYALERGERTKAERALLQLEFDF